MSYKAIKKRLRKALGASPTAFAAAINEILTCRKHPQYLSGILSYSSKEEDPNEVLFQWALRRGKIWLP
ncbi:MAG TPA: hypothetical protein PKA63_10035 [Oligoflexia bacterium]|nr:hypothetical protein [Oligoflexia bacterium]HMP48995.1 hypothetical protein [Oligoflexia bacterium]